MINDSAVVLETWALGILIIWITVYVLTTKPNISRINIISKAVSAFFAISVIVFIGGLL